MRRSVRSIALAALAAWCLQPAATRANDSALAYGGTPRMLSPAHPTVAMKREHIRMEIGEDTVTVDCRFVFENRGPACTVRMGFPDTGEGAANPDDAMMEERQPLRGAFQSFQSWVNGKPVKTALIRGEGRGSFWHVKTVRFPANATVTVRDRYTTEVGGGALPDRLLIHEASYVLHTGASWRGNIGRTEIEVVFKRKGVRAPLVVRKFKMVGDRPNFLENRSADKRIVYYTGGGAGAPTVRGTTLRFVRTNWRPTKADDLHLFFDMGRWKTGP